MFFHLHLVSDSTAETVSSIARATIAQFDNIDVREHTYVLVRTRGQIDQVLDSVRENPGFLMYTISDKSLRKQLKQGCEELNVPCISVLSRVISDLSSFLGRKTSSHQAPGRQHEMDEEYFSRVEAINFALMHDDGQSVWDLDEADIILVGASRTSKSPTSMYLANKGYRVANVPYVPGVPLPDIIFELKNVLVVGLTISPEMLVQIRKNRLLSLSENRETDYINMESVKKELQDSRKLFTKKSWPMIDVSRRSVEETAACIIQLYSEKEKT